MNEVVSYEYSQNHQALDIVSAGTGVSDVIAYDDGVVEIAVKNVKYTNHKTKGSDTYGNFIKIKHDDGKKTLYAHLKYGSVNVSSGERVSKGQKIGTMGATGNAYGTHLHFEVRNANETRANPHDFLNEKEESNPVDNSLTVEKEESKPLEKTNNDLPKVNEENSNVVSNNNAVDKQKNAEKTVNDSVTKNYSTASSKTYLGNNTYSYGSIVDGLKEIGIDSSFENRTALAHKNGIKNYCGTYNQNVYLLSLLKQGKLKA